MKNWFRQGFVFRILAIVDAFKKALLKQTFYNDGEFLQCGLHLAHS